jgi:hypothetical protein
MGMDIGTGKGPTGTGTVSTVSDDPGWTPDEAARLPATVNRGLEGIGGSH